MTTSTLPYKLRPNKAVDRELFISLLGRLSAAFKIEKYKYIGLGGPFLEDFRLLHARVGIRDMDCVEMDETVHCRQKFNKPIGSINCVYANIDDYLERTEFKKPVILWLDYADPRSTSKQIEVFTKQMLNLPPKSIIRLTLNANPASLREPDTILRGEELHEWRLQRFKERFADYYPVELSPDDMKHRNYGRSILKVLQLSVENVSLAASDRKILWAFATHYLDGQPMVTATLIIVNPKDKKITRILRNWEFYTESKNPHIIALPALSTIERLTMESNDNPRDILGYDLPELDLGGNPYQLFKKYYRVFPHFARIDL